MTKFFLTGIAIVICALVIGLFLTNGPMLGATGITTISNPHRFNSTLRIGSSGTALDMVKIGDCVMAASANTIAASTTAGIECTVSGAVANDSVIVTTSTSSSVTLYSGLQIIGQNASSTSGSITLKVFNGTGGTFTWTAAASTSGFQYRVLSQ